MADADAKQRTETTQDQEQRLKYLDFVQVAAIHAIVFFSSIYDFAKENSGPLKPGVQTVEGAVKNVIGPVYEKFHDVPLELLKFADRKVAGLVDEVERHVPSLVKTASSRAVSAAHVAPEVARSVASEVQRAGVVETATELARRTYVKLEPTVKELYTRYEPVGEQYAASAWRTLNKLPLFPEVAHVLVPTAAYWSDRYNHAVGYVGERGYAVSSFLPLIPTERIAKVFSDKGGGGASEGDSDAASLPPSGEAVATSSAGGK